MSTGFYAKWLASHCNLLSLLLAGKLLSTLSNFNVIDTHSELRIMQAAALIWIALLLTMDICPFTLASKHCSSLWKPFTTAATRKTQSGGRQTICFALNQHFPQKLFVPVRVTLRAPRKWLTAKARSSASHTEQICSTWRVMQRTWDLLMTLNWNRKRWKVC